MPFLRKIFAGSSSINPFTAKPSASSLPSPVWPPTSAQFASFNTSSAPVIIWNSTSSTLASSPDGTVAIAVADCASAPIAQMSPSAWFAATLPKM